MIGSPTILLTGYPFEVFDGVVGDITVFVVTFEGDFIFADRSRSFKSKKDDDMTRPVSKLSHRRINIAAFTIVAMSPGCSHTWRKMVKDFSESAVRKREEMTFAIRIEDSFAPAFFGNDALGEGELSAICRARMYDARVIEIVGEPHDDDFGFCRFHNTARRRDVNSERRCKGRGLGNGSAAILAERAKKINFLTKYAQYFAN